MKRSTTYQFTVRMENGNPVTEDAAKVQELKSHLKWYNKQVKKEEGQIYGRTVGERPLYVKLQGRLGKNNPASAKYRASGIFQRIAPVDAQTADVYVYQR